MNVILFVMICLLAFIAYRTSKGNVLSPSFIICAVFALSSLFVIANGKNWNFSVSIDTLTYLLFAISVTLLGVYIGTRIIPLLKRKEDIYLKGSDENISIKWMIVLSFTALIILYMYFSHQLKTSIMLGNSNGIFGMISTLRSHVYDEEALKVGYGLNIGISFLRAVGYISTFLFINQLVVYRKIECKYIMPICTLVIYYVLSTGRSGFIGFVCAVLYDFYFSLSRVGHKINQGKTVKYIVIGFIVFIMLFWQLGKLTGKDAILNFWDTLSIYIGSSILCIDAAIGNINSFNFIGTNTFRGIYNILNRLGLDVTTVSNHADKIRWNGYSSNVYTAFFPYYCDYGPIVSMFIALVAGVIIGIAWKKFISDVNNVIIGVLYPRFIAGAVAMYSIAERLFTNTLALNAFVEMFFMFIVLKICVKKREGKYLS